MLKVHLVVLFLITNSFSLKASDDEAPAPAQNIAHPRFRHNNRLTDLLNQMEHHGGIADEDVFLAFRNVELLEHINTTVEIFNQAVGFARQRNLKKYIFKLVCK